MDNYYEVKKEGSSFNLIYGLGVYNHTGRDMNFVEGTFPLKDLPQDLIDSLIFLNKRNQDQKDLEDSTKFTLISSSWWGVQKALKWRHIPLTNAAIKHRHPHNQWAMIPVKGYVEPISSGLGTINMEYFSSANDLLSALGSYNPERKILTATHIPKGMLIGYKGETIKAISELVGFRIIIK